MENMVFPVFVMLSTTLRGRDLPSLGSSQTSALTGYCYGRRLHIFYLLSVMSKRGPQVTKYWTRSFQFQLAPIEPWC
ncbi:hypothetical protein P170DRAFT_2935 [Aspergillus steynii IBT 23096]|uniref:Uncharacterized protein n=1 Tax=Aspergillus steynii IBT 23096 TaxID=1392250 RepID=A0A2I2GLG5_9EURO|nr:uncharacterized protein P170DRAFT_2935 [Aspergillus steynii IBT 23096]PLB53715.1 hypothetical protein P170DRAFT_2935 [Aspergillus steynii IBT 23096]